MTQYVAMRDAKRAPMHPGELLRDDILPALGRTKTEIAELLNISRQTLHDILEQKQPVTPIMALRLGKLCGNGTEVWLALQSRFDLWQARRKVNVDKIPTLHS
jgi:addiction module HigA family antidote